MSGTSVVQRHPPDPYEPGETQATDRLQRCQQRELAAILRGAVSPALPTASTLRHWHIIQRDCEVISRIEDLLKFIYG